jgi:excinuclease ABC subunit A
MVFADAPFVQLVLSSYDDGYEKYSNRKSFEGVVNNLERKYLETDSDWKERKFHNFKTKQNAERCKGMRLKEEALSVKIKELNISEVSKMSIQSAS